MTSDPQEYAEIEITIKRGAEAHHLHFPKVAEACFTVDRPIIGEILPISRAFTRTDKLDVELSFTALPADDELGTIYREEIR